MTVRIQSVAYHAIDAVPVEVEVQKTHGLFGTVSMVGLPSHSVRESSHRVRAAFLSSKLRFPKSSMIINFAPADLKKEGSFYDLPVALGILAISEIIPPAALEGFVVLGELALNGAVRPVPGTLSAAVLARESGLAGVVVPRANFAEARLVPGIDVRPADHLRQVAALFGAVFDDEPTGFAPGPVPERKGGQPPTSSADRAAVDFVDVIGQESAKEALTVCAAGGHNILMIGPPGSGKTMLATRLPTILPEMDLRASLEVSRIYSFIGRGLRELITRPPFRSPHHTVSHAGLVGGGSFPRPGEISLAHRGILFLDELPEFGRRTLETLRQPLEDGVITLSRAAGSVTLPAQISLIGSMNPCPCGFYGDKRCRCSCTPKQIQLYLNRISGPILDRLDMHIEVPAVPHHLLCSDRTGFSSRELADRVAEARQRQMRRMNGETFRLNARLGTDQLKRHCPLLRGARLLLEEQMERYPLSARGYNRILRVTRTLGDLDGQEQLEEDHVRQAVMFRSLDRLPHCNDL